MKLKVALLFLMVSVSDLSHALYGARPIQKGTFSSVVTLHLEDPKQSNHAFCSGVLIAANKVLTAGHCIDVIGVQIYDDVDYLVYSPDLLRVKVNGVKIRAKTVTYAKSYFEHDGIGGEDLAIIELVHNVSVVPARIAKTAPKIGTRVTMVAKGLEATTTIVGTQKDDFNNVLFTDGSTAGLCAGDSGGALFVNNGGKFELAGILASDGEGCEKKTGVAHFPSLNF